MPALEIEFYFGTSVTGGMVVSQLVSWDVVASNERKPLLLVAIIQLGTLARLPVINRRKVGMRVKSSCPLWPVASRLVQRVASRDGKPISAGPSSIVAAPAYVKSGIASNRGSARRGEYVPGPCTHRPSHHESL